MTGTASTPTDSTRERAREGALEQAFNEATGLGKRLDREIGRIIIGQQRVRREILLCLFAGGHCLLRGVPGLAKTLLIKTLADALHLKFNRIQFTPDLMPSDILGTEVIEEDQHTGKRHVRFIPGPIFSNIILADEINRTPPRTQAALLEAMQEYQVTIGGERHPLERPLFVLATQNPIEQEGTHPLPEAQLDRFMFNVVMDYPDAEDERRILSDTTGTLHTEVDRVATGEQLEAARAMTRALPAATNVVDFALRLIRASRPADASAPADIKEWVRWGAGPRAGQALLLGAKASALLDGRAAASIEDVIAVAHPVLRHRLLVNFRAEADGITSERVIDRLLQQTRA
jgi:MoxR-like ATPase